MTRFSPEQLYTLCFGFVFALIYLPTMQVVVGKVVCFSMSTFLVLHSISLLSLSLSCSSHCDCSGFALLLLLSQAGVLRRLGSSLSSFASFFLRERPPFPSSSLLPCRAALFRPRNRPFFWRSFTATLLAGSGRLRGQLRGSSGRCCHQSSGAFFGCLRSLHFVVYTGPSSSNSKA